MAPGHDEVDTAADAPSDEDCEAVPLATPPSSRRLRQRSASDPALRGGWRVARDGDRRASQWRRRSA